METVSIPVVNTALTRPVTDLMEAVCLDVTLGILGINVIKVYFVIDIRLTLSAPSYPEMHIATAPNNLSIIASF